MVKSTKIDFMLATVKCNHFIHLSWYILFLIYYRNGKIKFSVHLDFSQGYPFPVWQTSGIKEIFNKIQGFKLLS